MTRDTCSVQVTQLVCVLPANIAHMKLYLLLCCWLAALATAGAAQLGHRLLTLASPASLLAGSASLLVLLASSLANSDPRSVVVSFLLVVARLSRSFWSVGLSYGLMCGANFIMISGEE